MSGPMPAIFFGHGNPMNALERNAYTEVWAAIGRAVPRPKAILSVSAHWYQPDVAVTVSTSPKTIHDFGGFPRPLYEVQYPAPGDPELARRLQTLLAPIPVNLDERWGLDHGTWSVLCHVYPDADIPVVQLSIDETQPASFHYDIGQRIAPLREVEPFGWAQDFEIRVRELVLADRPAPLINYESLGRDAILSVPTPDHYLPLLYVLGTRIAEDRVTFPVEGVDGGSISMLTVCLGS
jgi:4,5-DOPA dioxygenase extradiol